jgi:hypothetical protein
LSLIKMRSLLLISLLITCHALADEPGNFQLQPVYRMKPVAGRQEFMPGNDFRLEKRRAEVEAVAFRAVCTNVWPPGLVPIFAVEKTNRIELRRRPAFGVENSSEPLFYALARSDELETPKIAGTWDCIATRGPETKEFFGWEFAIEDDKVAGRFDPFTSFRFARLAGGTFRSNRLELRIEYLNDVYIVQGEWRDAKLEGKWWHSDQSESGTWQATRADALLPPGTNLVALYEWRHPNGERRYLVEGDAPGPAWERAPIPLCRVWKREL